MYADVVVLCEKRFGQAENNEPFVFMLVLNELMGFCECYCCFDCNTDAMSEKKNACCF